MKILYITEVFSTYEKPALGPFIMRRIHALQDAGHEVTVLSLRYTSVSGRNWLGRRFKQLANLLFGGFLIQEMSPDYRGCQFKIHRLTITKIRFLNSLTILISLWRYFSVYSYDVAHLHFLWYAHPAFLIKKYWKIPLVISIHGGDIDFSMNKNIRLKDYIKQNNKIMHLADRVIFVSSFLNNLAVEYGYKSKNSVVINNGVDTHLFYHDKKYKKLQKKNKAVGYVGYLYEAKGVAKLPLIFFLIRKKYKNASFFIIGDDGPPHKTREYIKQKLYDLKLDKYTHMTGELIPQEVAEYMRKLDVLVLPTDSEGFGCVVVEARACGVPVVATDVGGVPEAMSCGGVLVKKQSEFEAAFAEAVIKLLSNPPSLQKIQAGVCSWSEIAQEEISIYNDIIQSKNPKLYADDTSVR